MKKGKLLSIIALGAIYTVFLVGCKKDNSSSPSVSGLNKQATAQVENLDVQDAISDRVDQTIDNTLDELQVNNYNPDNSKSAISISGNISITVDHPDSSYFPKLVTIIFNNYEDSTADEYLKLNGEIDLVVTIGGNSNQLVNRVLTFKNFSVTTDITTFSVQGTRTVERTSITPTFYGLKSLRISITDHITASLFYSITKSGSADSLKFSRTVDRMRMAVLHYANKGMLNWHGFRFRNIVSQDTIVFTGTVTGLNEKNYAYTKTISTNSPLTFIFLKGTPVISSGAMDLTLNNDTTTASYTFTFKQDLPDHPFKTLVTVVNNATKETTTFVRRFSRFFIRWW